jgi:hypothetical protein
MKLVPIAAQIAGNYNRMTISGSIAFTLSKRYKSSASIMPPDQQNSSALMLAALASHSPGLGSEACPAITGGVESFVPLPAKIHARTGV